MSLQTTTNPAEERIGAYRVHPVASMFPLLEGLDYDELRDSIEVGGQIYPIIVLGDMLLDGRNRLRACLDLKIEPLIQEYTGSRKPESFIESVNIDRRHLTDDMRATIGAQIRAWRIEHLNAEQKAAARAAQALHGRTGGRGHKKPLNTDSGSRVSQRDTAAMHARSTVGQIAEAAKISHHKAAQAVAVAKAAPDLAEKVAKGQMKLREAAKEVKKANREEAKAPSSQEHQVIGKRQHIRQQAAKNRMIAGLSQIRGMCRGLAGLNIAFLTASMDAEEKRVWLKTARENSRVLREFARRWEAQK